jgi:hypothetical protein
MIQLLKILLLTGGKPEPPGPPEVEVIYNE